jgi:hypothetical protein
MTISPVERSINGEDLVAEVIPKKWSAIDELGLTGLKRTTGYVDEEFLPQLRGRKAVQVFKEMSENDAIVGALLYSVQMLLREVEWRVEACGQEEQDVLAAQFLESCMEDMSHTWDDLIVEILSCLTYGWSWHEIVYKKRDGENSKYDDGLFGWRKIPIRSQETLLRWAFDDTGGVKAMVQLAPPHYKTVVIPVEKSLLFRTSLSKGNPEGRSLLRNAYRSWYFKKRAEEIEAIGMERDLAGMPVGKLPAEYFDAPAGSKQEKMLKAFQKMVRSVRRDEQEGILIPNSFDQDTKQPLFDFQLLSSSGGRQFDTNAIIQRLEQRMLMTVMADFIMVGHQNVGSYALHTDKTGLFRASINSIAMAIADVFNRHAVPRLFEINGIKLGELPKIVPNDVDPPDLTQLSQFMGQMSSVGMNWFPDPELEKFLRSAARLPDMSPEQEQIREQEEKQNTVMRLAQQQMGILGIRQQAMMGEASLQQQMNAPDPNAQAQMQMQQSQDQHKMKLSQQAEIHAQKMKQAKEGNSVSRGSQNSRGKTPPKRK